MNLSHIHSIYFIGIGGIGMSGLARFFLEKGIQVKGYDKTQTPLTNTLETLGASITYQDDVQHIDQHTDLIIYTPAISKTHQQLNWAFVQNKIQVCKRAEVLGILSKNLKAIAVAGTHGKTSTSAMVAQIMHHSTLGCNAFIGGILSEFNSNILTNKESAFTVLEADEFDRSFLHLSPFISIINSIDADHLDIYQTHENMLKAFQAYADLTHKDGHLIIEHSIAKHFNNKHITFSAHDKQADIYAKNTRIEKGQYHIDVVFKEQTTSIALNLPGKHNIANALAAFAACHLAGVSTQSIKQSLESFQGIHRRFQFAYTSEQCVLIDDYAHHPTEIQTAIQTAKALYPEKKLTVVFQPHLFSRTQDFMQDFATELSRVDQLFLLDIYPAREAPIQGVSSEVLLKKITIKDKCLCTLENCLETILKHKHEVLLVLGAGDISTITEPLKKALSDA